jgi:ABC-type multidrug transport system ATPase subunit/ABC-type multidrug transport system permease subunit
MSPILESLRRELRERLRDAWQRLPLVHRLLHSVQFVARRLARRPRTVTESPNLLPLLIQVLAAFSKGGASVLQEEIDSSLGFLRHDFPEAVYSELRQLFRHALQEQHDLGAMAQKLSAQLDTDQKIMLGVQLYDLIARAGMDRRQLVEFYSFMTQLGMAAQAIDIVYQLSSSDTPDPSVYQSGSSPLECVSFGASGGREDVGLRSLHEAERMLAFRYHELLLLKNISAPNITVRGRPLKPGDFCRIYSGQRTLLGEEVLSYQELAYYFNAKKNVSLTQIYLCLDNLGELELQREKSRDSSIEVRFGLKVQVRAIKTSNVHLNGVHLTANTVLEAGLDDRLVFDTDSELPLSDLRRRARALGGRFQLKTYKASYLVSNNPSLLDVDDILLSPGTGGEVLFRILCDYDHRVGTLEILHADRPLQVGEQVLSVGSRCALQDGATIRLDAGQVLRCDFSERIIEEERNVISTLEVRDLTYRFRKNLTALDALSFSVSRGEMVCVMGASGSGKSTLLRAIGGQLHPTEGQVLLNGQQLYSDLDTLKRFVTYIPQDDAFDDYLTIEENMEFAAAIRSPHLSKRDRARRVEGKLVELGLAERRDSVVGSTVKKMLSGGERKRLNIGLDMLSSADVFLFDEPTSGLSSKDSEHVLEILRGMVHNKIILVTLHQPTSKLFQMFTKALLLDKGGRLAFYGTPQEMLAYFAEAEHEQQFGAELGGCPACGTTRPEFIFDVLETPLRDLSGDIIYEENNRGQLVPARRFSADFWQDRYDRFRLLQEMKQVNVRESAQVVPQPTPLVAQNRRLKLREEWAQLRTLWKRSFTSKLRNRGNMILTVLVPPALAAVIGWALYFTKDESGSYDFSSAFHIPTYIFISLLVAMFLALVSSVDDIIRDRVLLNRERNLTVRLPFYILAKLGTLSLFSAVQCALFVAVGNSILEVRGMFLPYWYFMFVTALSGLALGLLVSSLASSSKMAANFVPLVLIPQLIFSGALVKYEEMNRDPDLLYSLQRWFVQNPDPKNPDAAAREAAERKLRIPAVSRLVATHYSYEALIVAQAKLNPLTRRQDALQEEIDALAKRKNRTAQENKRLEDLKQALIEVSVLHSDSGADLDRRMRGADRVLRGTSLQESGLNSSGTKLTAQRRYTNQKVGEMVYKAETEQNDYRLDRKVNVFFSPDKYLWEMRVSVYVWNSLVLLLSSVALLTLLNFILSRQLRPSGRAALEQ